jgi:hypothetical protein
MTGTSMNTPRHIFPPRPFRPAISSQRTRRMVVVAMYACGAVVLGAHIALRVGVALRPQASDDAALAVGIVGVLALLVGFGALLLLGRDFYLLAFGSREQIELDAELLERRNGALRITYWILVWLLMLEFVGWTVRNLVLTLATTAHVQPALGTMSFGGTALVLDIVVANALPMALLAWTVPARFDTRA